MADKKSNKTDGFFDATPRKKKEISGKIYAFRGLKIIVEVDGNGVLVDFDEKKHKGLKVGDSITL